MLFPLLLLLLGCAPRPEQVDSIDAAAHAGRERLEGTVRIVGSAPLNVQVVLQPEDGRAIRIVGPRAAEIGRLGGLHIVVTGRLERSTDPVTDRQLQVSEYEILSANGLPVVSGEIIWVSGGSAGLRTRDGEEVLLSSVPRDFQVGQRVWVQGPRTLSVQTFGTILP